VLTEMLVVLIPSGFFVKNILSEYLKLLIHFLAMSPSVNMVVLYLLLHFFQFICFPYETVIKFFLEFFLNLPHSFISFLEYFC
jgi:hypothetical protein